MFVLKRSVPAKWNMWNAWETGVVACGLSGGVDNLCYLVTSRFKFLEEYIMRCTIIIHDTQTRLLSTVVSGKLMIYWS